MDPIADMLIRIKNNQAVKKETAMFGYSKMKWDIAKILERSGYLGDVNRKGKKNRKLIEVTLLYDEAGNPKISGVKRISKPGRRVYKSFREIQPVNNSFGSALYSTSKGIVTDRDARKEKIGGEALCEIW